MTFKRKLGEAYGRYKVRIGRGASFTGEISGFISGLGSASAITLLINSYTEIKIPFYVLPIVYVTQKLLEYTLGYLDEKYLHWWHYENEYVSRNLNPWNQEVMEKLNFIKENMSKNKPKSKKKPC